MILFPLIFVHWLIIASLALTGIGAVVLCLLIVKDYFNRNIW